MQDHPSLSASLLGRRYRIFACRVAAICAALLAASACFRDTSSRTSSDAELRFDQDAASVATEDHMQGSPNKALHRPLSHPRYLSNEQAGAFLEDDDAVWLFSTGGVTFVYPEEFLSYHHVINETIHGPLKGTVLGRPAWTRVFWFSWSAFYPRTKVFSEK